MLHKIEKFITQPLIFLYKYKRKDINFIIEIACFKMIFDIITFRSIHLAKVAQCSKLISFTCLFRRLYNYEKIPCLKIRECLLCYIMDQSSIIQ